MERRIAAPFLSFDHDDLLPVGQKKGVTGKFMEKELTNQEWHIRLFIYQFIDPYYRSRDEQELGHIFGSPVIFATSKSSKARFWCNPTPLPHNPPHTPTIR